MGRENTTCDFVNHLNCHLETMEQWNKAFEKIGNLETYGQFLITFSGKYHNFIMWLV